MDAMGHEHPRVQLVVPDFRSLLDRSRGRIRGRKAARCRKTVVPAEGDEQRLADDIWRVRPALRDAPGLGSGLGGRRRPRACPTNVKTPEGSPFGLLPGVIGL